MLTLQNNKIKKAPSCLNDKKGRAYGLPDLTAAEGFNAFSFSFWLYSKILLYCSGLLMEQQPDSIS